MRYTHLLLAALCTLVLLGPCEARSITPNDYGKEAAWLCLPGHVDACSTALTSTVISPDTGDPVKRNYGANPSAPIDCFYVYPTVSREPTANADMTLGPEEQHAVTEQFARFGAKCRTYAPLYRQMTVAALTGEASDPDYDLAYRDVLDAWRFYMAHYNQGRGVVLIGHSQGTALLTRLITEQLDGKKAQQRMVSTILLGGSIEVPSGHDVGGTFQHVPLCRKATQLGCVIAYSSYLATRPPGPDADFGAAAAGSIDACVNPAELANDGSLDAELPTVGEVAKVLGTTFVENPGAFSAACTTTSGARTFLAISIKPTVVGAQRLERSLTALTDRRPGWGLHVLDVNIALGDLVTIVGDEGQAWAAQAH